MITKQNSKSMNEFDQKARDWDKNRMNLERTIAVAGQLSKLIPEKPGMKALEFGAGTGLLSFYLKYLFSQITLMDSSAEMLKMAESKMDETDRQKFQTLFLNIETEEYSGEKLDVIYNQMVLHHIKDPSAIFRKFYQMLNLGGILAISDLYEEDGSFHDFNMDIHRGFDPEKLRHQIIGLGFEKTTVSPCFVIRKELTPDLIKEYPVFLLSAIR